MSMSVIARSSPPSAGRPSRFTKPAIPHMASRPTRSAGGGMAGGGSSWSARYPAHRVRGVRPIHLRAAGSRRGRLVFLIGEPSQDGLHPRAHRYDAVEEVEVGTA